MKEKRFEKVVEWEEYNSTIFLFFGILFFILGLGYSFWNHFSDNSWVGIIVGAFFLLLELIGYILFNRKVTWREIK